MVSLWSPLRAVSHNSPRGDGVHLGEVFPRHHAHQLQLGCCAYLMNMLHDRMLTALLGQLLRRVNWIGPVGPYLAVRIIHFLRRALV